MPADPKPLPPPEPCDQCGSRVFSVRRHDLGAPTDQFPFTSPSKPYWRCLVCSRAMDASSFRETTDSRIDSLTRALQAELAWHRLQGVLGDQLVRDVRELSLRSAEAVAGLVRMNLDTLRGAAAQAEQAIEQHPDHPEVAAWEAMVSTASVSQEHAESLLRRLLDAVTAVEPPEPEPEEPTAEERAENRARMRRYKDEEAEKSRHRMVALSEQRHSPYFQLGAVVRQKDDPHGHGVGVIECVYFDLASAMDSYAVPEDWYEKLEVTPTSTPMDPWYALRLLEGGILVGERDLEEATLPSKPEEWQRG